MKRNRLRMLALAVTACTLATGIAAAQIRDPLEVQKGRDVKLKKRGSVAYYAERWDLSELPAYEPQQRVTGNIADIEKLVTDGLVDLLAGLLTLIGVISVMLFLSPQYTLIALAIAPALFLIVLGYTKNIKAAAKKAAKARWS